MMRNLEMGKDITRCALCQSPETVKTASSLMRAIYFCLDCGKSFERKPSPEAPRPAGPDAAPAAKTLSGRTRRRDTGTRPRAAGR